ncbi:hypothetical protein EZV62_021669 [Acer yangbiense]|uniref:Cytochrome P450 n=1 Tax=Acer yangbiense TaxID=1000413 RepID=A0A5C7H699_9ROSI|nr:hypothetical protein EZV62_021669 [Acer yangbiense]
MGWVWRSREEIDGFREEERQIYAGFDRGASSIEQKWRVTRSSEDCLLDGDRKKSMIEVLLSLQESESLCYSDEIISSLMILNFLILIVSKTKLYPAAPLSVPRESSEDCNVGGFRIPRGTMLLVNMWGIQNDPEIWEDPGNYRPERFEGFEGKKIRWFQVVGIWVRKEKLSRRPVGDANGWAGFGIVATMF